MKDIWFISDTHFGHSNMLNFKTYTGEPVRVFKDVEEMDETMVQNWNRVVKPFDRVYHLGDVVINKKHLPLLNRLNGKKVLVKGNHDIYDLTIYQEYFEDIRAYKVFSKEGFICSHIPLHPECLERFKVNVHGHLHTNIVKDQPQKYINVCVEQINYTPIHYDDIIKRINLG